MIFKVYIDDNVKHGLAINKYQYIQNKSVPIVFVC